VLSEFDFVWRKSLGFRVSAAGWYDNAYDGKNPVGNPNLVVPPAPAFGPFPPLRQALPNGGQLVSYDNGEYSPYVKRYYAGPSGELLDAFVFASFDAGDVPVSIKAGRHTVYWGESLLLGGAVHGISYSQMPLDLQKGFATPGTEVKELFRPLGQVSAQAQLGQEVSVALQYFYEWDSARYPEGGTYLGPADPLFNGPDRQIVPVPSPTRVTLVNAARGEASEPKQGGDFGAALRWSPQWLDGTVGFYYRRYSDKLPNVFLTSLVPTPIYANSPTPTVVAVNGEYKLVYKDSVDLYGISLSKQIAGVSVGAEVSYRHNTPLFSRLFSNVVGQTFGRGDTPGAVGDTWHGLVNAIGIVPKTFLWDTAVYQTELTFSRCGQGAQRRPVLQRRRLRRLPDQPRVGRFARRATSSARRRTSRRRGSRCSPAPISRCRSPGRRACRATRPPCSAATRMPAPTRSASGSITASSGASTSSTSTSSASTRPAMRRSAAASPSYRRTASTRCSPTAATSTSRSRRRSDLDPRRTLMRIHHTLIAAAVAAALAAPSLAAVTVDEAKQLGTTLTASAPRRRQQGRHDPAYTGGLARRRRATRRAASSARSVRGREAATGHHRQGRRGAGGQAHGRHEGAAQALPDDAARRLSDAPHRRVPQRISTTR
jgi:hypothetical protein